MTSDACLSDQCRPPSSVQIFDYAYRHTRFPFFFRSPFDSVYIMNGYEDFSAGSQYPFDITNGHDDDMFEEMQPRWPHLHNQPLQMHGYEQSSTGIL